VKKPAKPRPKAPAPSKHEVDLLREAARVAYEKVKAAHEGTRSVSPVGLASKA